MRSSKFILQGGLGNQLFIFMAALHNFTQENKGSTINLVTSELDRASTKRKLEITEFELNLPVVFSRLSTVQRFRLRLTRRFSRVFSVNFHTRLGFYISPEVGFDMQLLRFARGSIVSGYFQSWKYSSSIGATHFLKNLTLKSESELFRMLKREMMREDPLVVHIRRGDYINYASTFGLLSISYFDSAMQRYLQEFGQRNVWVFSDDITINLKVPVDWNVSKYVTSLNGLSPAETLKLMSLGSSIITSNSSFSWWSAFLMQVRDSNSIVIYPEPWSIQQPASLELIPDGWFSHDSEWDVS